MIMKILHTSDIHIGKKIYEQARDEEFNSLFLWLVKIVEEEKVDVFIAAGDIFDVPNPSNSSRKLYYRFLSSLLKTSCRKVIITSGNHDSAEFLGAPKSILDSLSVFVSSELSEKIEDEIVEIKDENGELEALVCAVPYLREKDISSVRAGETFEEQNAAYSSAISAHYKEVAAKASKIRGARDIPIIAVGHLFASNMPCSESVFCGEGQDTEERTISFWGNAVKVEPSGFPEEIDYLALGHIHMPQTLSSENPMRRYSGSPLRLSFGETGQKSVCLVTFNGKKPELKLVHAPEFHKMTRLKSSSPDDISCRLNALKSSGADDYLEIIFSGRKSVFEEFRRIVDEISEGSLFKVLKLKTEFCDLSAYERDNGADIAMLTDDRDRIFEMRLDRENLSEDEKDELRGTYREALELLLEDGI